MKGDCEDVHNEIMEIFSTILPNPNKMLPSEKKSMIQKYESVIHFLQKMSAKSRFESVEACEEDCIKLFGQLPLEKQFAVFLQQLAMCNAFQCQGKTCLALLNYVANNFDKENFVKLIFVLKNEKNENLFEKFLVQHQYELLKKLYRCWGLKKNECNC